MLTKLKEKVQFQNLMQLSPLLTSLHYITKSGMLGTQIYSDSMACSKPQNIQKLDGIQISVGHILKSLENNSKQQSFLQDAPSLTIFDASQNSKYAYVSINATYLVQLFQVLFQSYSNIFEHYLRAYSRIFRTLSISVFRTLAYFSIFNSKVYS